MQTTRTTQFAPLSAMRPPVLKRPTHGTTHQQTATHIRPTDTMTTEAKMQSKLLRDPPHLGCPSLVQSVIEKSLGSFHLWQRGASFSGVYKLFWHGHPTSVTVAFMPVSSLTTLMQSAATCCCSKTLETPAIMRLFNRLSVQTPKNTVMTPIRNMLSPVTKGRHSRQLEHILPAATWEKSPLQILMLGSQTRTDDNKFGSHSVVPVARHTMIVWHCFGLANSQYSATLLTKGGASKLCRFKFGSLCGATGHYTLACHADQTTRAISCPTLRSCACGQTFPQRLHIFMSDKSMDRGLQNV